MIDAAPTGIWTRKTPVTDNEERIVPTLHWIRRPGNLGVVPARRRPRRLEVQSLVAHSDRGPHARRDRVDIVQTPQGSRAARVHASRAAKQTGAFRRSDATKDKLFSLIAHDLRGPIGGMSNSSDHGDGPRRYEARNPR